MSFQVSKNEMYKQRGFWVLLDLRWFIISIVIKKNKFIDFVMIATEACQNYKIPSGFMKSREKSKISKKNIEAKTLFPMN
jgi:hypothetical protein